jgi:hypothetical protein
MLVLFFSLEKRERKEKEATSLSFSPHLPSIISELQKL